MKRFNRRRLGEHGQTMTEFALAVPVLLLVLVGMVVFGIAFNNYETLTFATNQGAQTLSFSRGSTSDPCATATTQIINSAKGLVASNLTYTIAFGTINTSGAFVPTNTYTGTTCSAASLIGGNTAEVTVTYPCNLKVLAFNFNPTSICLLTAQTAVQIQ